MAPVCNTSGESDSLLINSLKVIHNWLLSFLLPPTNKVWGKVIFSEVCVKNSVGGEEYLGRYLPSEPGRYTAVSKDWISFRNPPPSWDQAGTPWDQAGTPQTRQVPPGTRQVHPLDRAGTPLWDQAGTPPPSSICWEIRATSGRYASYWNAFLL